MTDTRLWRSRSRRLTVLLFVVTVPPALTFVWLGTRLLQQDRALLAQRAIERRQTTLQTIVRSLEQSLAEAERHLLDGPVPDGMVRLVQTTDSVRATPADRVVWLPARFPGGSSDNGAFQAGEQSEFSGRHAEALAAYRVNTQSRDATVRAGALIRIGRVHLGQGRWNEALRAYRELAGVSGATVEGAPADLQARRQLCATLERAGRKDELEREAVAFESDLLGGRWQVDGPAWELTIADLERWTGRHVDVPESRRLFSLAAESLWVRSTPASGRTTREVVSAGSTTLTVLRSRRDDSTVALVISPGAISDWIGAGLAAVLVLVGGGGYMLWRVMQRELEVSRLQTEFVSAVSHEFRTPLTSLRHATELLHESDDLPSERRRSFYDAMNRDTRRLQRLVESLLDFSRMEERRRAYDLRVLCAEELVAVVVDEFRPTVRSSGATIAVEVPGEANCVIRADAPALSNALWNLLDNAVKYSPEGALVEISVRPVENGVTITVRDQGLGIPDDERQGIFGRFVRGRRARLDGGGARPLGLGLQDQYYLDIHPNGRQLVFMEEDLRNELWIMRLPAAMRGR